MDNQIVRRLMAAGASPQRAQAFATQFQKSQQAKSPGRSLKPKDITDAFDAELEAASRQLFPEAFRPPTSLDQGFLDYAEFVLTPQRLKALTDRSYLDYAPTFKSNLDMGTGTFKGRLAQNIANGYTPQELQDIVQQEIALDPNVMDEFMDVTNPLNTQKNVDKFINDIYQEKTKFDLGQIKDVESVLKTDKEYKAGIPAKGLKYGTQTNLKKGIVSVETIPGVKPFVQKETTKFSTARQANPSIAPSSYMNPLENVASMATKKGLNPRDDEFQRRANIKFGK